MFKSKCEKIKDIDYSKSFVISKLFADEQMVKLHQERLMKFLKNPTPEELKKHIDAIVIKENAFNLIMEYIVSCFKFDLDALEVEDFKKRFAQQFADKKFDDAVLTDISKKLISKGLSFEVIAKDNNIVVSDQEAKDYLENYYKSTNNPINEFLNDPNKFNEIKSVILEEKITQWLLTKFKIDLKLDPQPSAPPVENK